MGGRSQTDADMTFLQPFILWGLPLILLPVLIHLINRMRHKPHAWAAMRFLVSATRSSVSNAKLRQFLILLFRVLAVAMLILFLSRPLAGGWIGWALSPAPDAIVLILDRSASMEVQAPGGKGTLRESALNLLATAASEFQEASHLVLIDSALKTPQEIHNASLLRDNLLTGPTDTSTDMPALLHNALDWILQNKAGTTEIWIASDLQKSNWHPEDSRWATLTAQFSGLPQKVRFRLLSVGNDKARSTAISVREIIRRQQGENMDQLQLVLDLQRRQAAAEKSNLPIQLSLDGAPSQFEAAIEGSSVRWRQKVNLGNKKTGGWGSVALPSDEDLRDNTAYFVYGSVIPMQALVVSSGSSSARFLRVAASSFNGNKSLAAQSVTVADFGNVTLEDKTLVVWQGPLPQGQAAERMETFAKEGGVLLFLPPSEQTNAIPNAARFRGLAWGAIETQPGEPGFRVNHWDEEQGPLAKSDEGTSLPLNQTIFNIRQTIEGEKNILAAFDDGIPFLIRQTLGAGEIYFCSSLPAVDWSSLVEGPVLVPMMQRMLLAGSRRLQKVASLDCGALSPADAALRWQRLAGAGGNRNAGDIRTTAGVFQSGERLLAINRPAAEDDLEILEEPEVYKLFGNLAVQTFQERKAQMQNLQGEIWRIFLFGMLIFLLVEGWLILPPKKEVRS